MTSYAVRTRSPVTSRAAVVYAHKNETIDVITSKSQGVRSGDLGGQSRRCSNLFERTCISCRRKEEVIISKAYDNDNIQITAKI